jgi:hypothetical protein
MGKAKSKGSMKTSTDRVNALRKRRRDAGLVKVEVWVKPTDKDKIKQLESHLNNS